MTEPLLYSTAPVFRLEGEINGELARDLLRLEVDETTAGLKTLTARLLAQGPHPGESNEGLLYLDGTVLDFGKKMSVSIGPTETARTIFEGVVSGLEVCWHEGRPPEVIVFCEDKLMDLRMTRRLRTYEKSSDADIVRVIASYHGLATEVDADGPTYDRVQQWNTSDLAFLRHRGRLIQAEIWLKDSTLCFQTRDKRSATALTLVQGNQLIHFTARADLAHQRTKIKVSGYDNSGRERIDEEADADAILAEISTGLTGPDVLKRAFGERVSYRVREVPLRGEEASLWARAEMVRRARSFVTVAGVTRGSPDMIVGSRLSFEGVGHAFEGDGYHATRVCHTYDAQEGHRTRFVAERPTIQEGA
jgi:phage protein D